MPLAIRWTARWSFVVAFVVGLGLPAGPLESPTAFGQCYEQQKLRAVDPSATDQFGSSVSISGNVAIVGVYRDNCSAGPQCGSAHVFRYNGSAWVQERKLTASDAAQYDEFGSAVSVSGNVAVVGAGGHDCAAGIFCGSAYVYRYTGSIWVYQQQLTASDAGHRDFFGSSVSVNGDVVVVGASRNNCAAGLDCGSAYVYRYDGSTWIEEATLTASDAAAQDYFGSAVSVSGDVAVVGAYNDDDLACSDCGSAYVYRYNGTTWVQQQKLAASDAGADDEFGTCVSVSGDVTVVGARYGDCAAGVRCGAAYVFRFNGATWVEERKLTASDAAAEDLFGFSVSVSGDVAVVGAPGDECAPAMSCGSAYVYRYNGSNWVETKVTASDVVPPDAFGRSVAVSGDTALVGAVGASCSAGVACGAAYVFTVGDCNDNDVPDGCDIGGGVSCDLDADAVPDECACVPGDFGDVDGDGDIGLDDILCVLDGFGGAAACPYGDLLPCGGDCVIDLNDILAVLDAFTGTYACPPPCI